MSRLPSVFQDLNPPPEKDNPVPFPGYILPKSHDLDHRRRPQSHPYEKQDKEYPYPQNHQQPLKEEYDALQVGDKIRVTGTKATWSGEEEIKNITSLEKIDGHYIAPAKDVTSLFGTDELEKNENLFVSIKGAVVVASKVKNDETEYPFLYKYNGSGERGEDLYFNVKIGEETYTFVVESDYQTQDSDAYKAVEALKVGDTIDLEGILYWYNGPQPHISKVVVK